MERIRKELEERRKYLLNIQKEKKMEFENAPDGSLRINVKDGRTQYYHRTDPKNFTGTYIKKKELEFARELAQKDYDKQVYFSAKQEAKAIEKALSTFPEREIEDIYDNLRLERRQLVHPISVPQKEFVENWTMQKYDGKGFDETTPEFYTAKGERVRSKSELIIAEALEREGIPYRYEAPLKLKGWGYVYPDFTLLDVAKRKEIYWEHLGMMDNPEYAEKAVQKIAQYERNGIYPGEGLILSYETRKTPIHQKSIDRMIARYLKS